MSKLDPAARMRAHREEMAFAVAHHMTLAEARAEMARLRWLAQQARLDDRRRAAAQPIHTPDEQQRPDLSDRWMMRN